MNKSLFRLLNYFKNYRWVIIKNASHSVINKLFDLAPEILIGIAIDVVVSKEESFIAKFGYTDPWDQIVVLSILTFFAWFFESLFEYWLATGWRNLAQKIQHTLRMDGYRHVQDLDLSYFEDKSSGRLVSILNDDVNQLERFLDGGINSLIQTFVALVGVGSIFFILSPKIAMFAFMPIPVIIFGAFWFQTKATPLYEKVRTHVGDLASRLSNNISGIITIKSFTKEKEEADSLEKCSSDYMEANYAAIKISSAFIPIIRMAILAGFIVTFLLGAKQVLDGSLPVGSYGILVFLTQRILWPMTALAATIDLYERAMASAKRILDLIEEPIEIRSGAYKTSKSIEGEFEFKDVNFSYKTGPRILSGLNLKLKAGETTAFVGSTGSGKSTIIKLLLRFYDIEDGSLKLDSKEVRDYDIKNLRNHIGLVSQDVFLFHGTVMENIAYAKPEANLEEVVEAAKMAEAHEFINLLPENYKTVVGERGQKLSGGQRQRISLARAILKDPSILILDEATSAVDNETEAAIQKSLAKVSQGRTVIVIAHRLSTIVSADNIYVVEKGSVVESGTHHELLEFPGAYHQLWNVQTGLNS